MPLGQPAPASAAAPTTQSPQRFAVQKGVAMGQSDAAVHCTHREVVVLQTGAVIVVQSAFAVHPALHMKFCWSQIGVVVPQSELVRQATHACVAT